MNIVTSLDNPITDIPTVLTIGKFDGFHQGHQRLIRTTVERAKQCSCKSAVMTFEPHPARVIHPEKNTRLLTSLDERVELIAAFEPDFLIVAPFNREIMQTSARAYMEQITRAMPLHELWVGTNFTIGHNREGTIQRLTEIGNELGYTVGTVSPVLIGGEPVSSSRVRKLLHDGIVEGIENLLGRPFSLRGLVVEGNGRGQQIGFPTANLAIDPLHAIPANGVYACCSWLRGTPLPSVVNVGVRPTFHNAEEPIVEAHLLDWSGDLYGQTLRLDFWYRLRNERKFSSVEQLVEQITRDVDHARELMSSYPNPRDPYDPRGSYCYRRRHLVDIFRRWPPEKEEK